MTLTRHKSFIEIVLLMLLVLAVQAGGVLAASPSGPGPAVAQVLAPALAPAAAIGSSERYALDSLSGFALRGFDAVAYFDEGKARPGDARHEAIWNGAAWRFASAANRAAFLRDPARYQPRFGGYDALAAGRGVMADADPTVFAIVGNALYLFRSPERRQHFIGDGQSAARAEAGWDKAQANLAH